MIGDSEQYMQLIQIYSEMGDDELLALAGSKDDLTETAQEVLRTEMGKRRLRLEPSVQQLSVIDTEEDDDLRFGVLASPDYVWEFPEAEDAIAAGEWLGSEGIKYDVILPSMERMDRGAPRVAVMPKDAARAGEMLAKPIPEEFRILVRTREEFVVPKCRRCGADDPLLESIEPANHWKCESCGHEWVETL